MNKLKLLDNKQTSVMLSTSRSRCWLAPAAAALLSSTIGQGVIDVTRAAGKDSFLEASLMQVDASTIQKVDEIVPFLKAYPFPAFIHCSRPTQTRDVDRIGFPLEPAWSNRAFDALFTSHEQFLTSIGLGEPLVSYGVWLEAKDGLNDAEPTTHRLTLKIPWVDEENEEIEKEVTTELEL
ncbi:hypothetical protein FRC17_009829, partial [Serendipita sp. 399]